MMGYAMDVALVLLVIVLSLMAMHMEWQDVTMGVYG